MVLDPLPIVHVLPLPPFHLRGVAGWTRGHVRYPRSPRHALHIRCHHQRCAEAAAKASTRWVNIKI